jgi:hypothetical protein
MARIITAAECDLPWNRAHDQDSVSLAVGDQNFQHFHLIFDLKKVRATTREPLMWKPSSSATHFEMFVSSPSAVATLNTVFSRQKKITGASFGMVSRTSFRSGMIFSAFALLRFQPGEVSV